MKKTEKSRVPGIEDYKLLKGQSYMKAFRDFKEKLLMLRRDVKSREISGYSALIDLLNIVAIFQDENGIASLADIDAAARSSNLDQAVAEFSEDSCYSLINLIQELGRSESIRQENRINRNCEVNTEVKPEQIFVSSKYDYKNTCFDLREDSGALVYSIANFQTCSGKMPAVVEGYVGNFFMKKLSLMINLSARVEGVIILLIRRELRYKRGDMIESLYN